MAIEHFFSLHTGYIDFTGYLRYLDSIQARMPVHVYEFASDPAHHDLNARTSLHDAWLQSLTIGETAEGSRQRIRQTEIRLCLLGPYHDRHIHLHYTGVEAYAFQSPARHDAPRYSHTAHGDLLAHAIWVNPAGMLVHDMVFERGSTLRVECADIRHAQEPLQ